MGATVVKLRSPSGLPSFPPPGSLFTQKSLYYQFKRYLQISMGSLFEIQTQLYIAFGLKYIHRDQFRKVIADSREIERMLSSLIRKIST